MHFNYIFTPFLLKKESTVVVVFLLFNFCFFFFNSSPVVGETEEESDWTKKICWAGVRRNQKELSWCVFTLENDSLLLQYHIQKTKNNNY